MKDLFTTSGLKPEANLAVYCHFGQPACIVYTAARRLGYKVHIYDRSFEEWSARDDLPLEASSKPIAQQS